MKEHTTAGLGQPCGGAAASITAEAAYVAGLTILILFFVIGMTFYLRDRAVAAARVRQLCMEQTVTDRSTDRGAPVFTLTEGTIERTDAGASARIRMTGLWPMSALHGGEQAQRSDADMPQILRRRHNIPDPKSPD